MPVLVLSLVDNATLAGNGVCYIFPVIQDYHTLAVWFNDVS